MDTCHRQKIVNLSMDIEDVYGDKEILDTVLIELILFLISNEIPCDFYITGIRFDLIKSDSELFRLLHSDIIKCGTHTNTHSFTPISCMKNSNEINFCEKNYFEPVKKKFLMHKKSGVQLIEEEFKPNFFRCPGFCWSPDYFEYMKMKNYHFTTIDINYPRPFQFMNLTIMPVVYKPLEAFKSVIELDEHMSHFNAVSVYLHPSRLIYDNFWDKKVKRNIYKDIPNRIAILKEMLLHLKSAFNMISLSELDNYCVESNQTSLSINEIINSMTSKWSWSQLPDSFFSSSQINRIHKEHKTLKELKLFYE